MRQPPQTDRTDAEFRDRAWELAKSIGICMLVTWDGEKQRARPMAANPKRDEHAIYFLADKDSEQVAQANRFPVVTATFADLSSNKYVAISGRATVRDDRTKIMELWNAADKAWWDSSDDPAIRVIQIEPTEAELWDSPGRLVAAVKMLTAAATGIKPSLGEKARVEI